MHGDTVTLGPEDPALHPGRVLMAAAVFPTMGPTRSSCVSPLLSATGGLSSATGPGDQGISCWSKLDWSASRGLKSWRRDYVLPLDTHFLPLELPGPGQVRSDPRSGVPVIRWAVWAAGCHSAFPHPKILLGFQSDLSHW